MEVYAFLLLHHEPHQNVEYTQLKQHFATIAQLLRFNLIKDMMQGISTIPGDVLTAEGMLELMISGFIGIFSSIAKSSLEYTPIPTLLFNFFHSQVPIDQIMNSYITLQTA